MTTFCFDLDGTLCTNTDGDYEQAEPYRWAIERVNALAAVGHRIMIFTARGSTTGIDWRDVTLSQLRAWGVTFHELRLGKPTADVFVDDRTYQSEAWRWGQTMVIPAADTSDTSRRTALGYGLVGLPPLALGNTEVGRTYKGRALWLAEHLDAVLDGVDPPCPREQLLERLRAAIEPSGGVLGAVGEVIFTLHCIGEPHAAYLDVYEPRELPAVAVSCRPWRDAARALRDWQPSPTWLGMSAFSLSDGRVRARFNGDVTSRHVLDAARAAGLDLQLGDASVSNGDEGILVCAPFPVIPAGKPGPMTRRLIAAVTAMTGVDPVAQLGDL